MLKLSPLMVLFLLTLSLFLFSGKAISSDDKIFPIGFINGRLDFIQNQKYCIVKNKKMDGVILEEKNTLSETDRCIAECSYLLDMPGDYGSTNFHSCVSQCKGQIASCDF
ncbi:hypothetical protein [Pectobacterium brasiliense]|uniref:hypothetical protein n=1 Tax=Pectobacterium brasiliense TaxID=180957 RepID=UPI001968AEDE|nr:hypothetical protein [Pectobacterium brasiliense]MBN3262391.1 hypothetical protein [Pectobacterium brasiliense]